VKCETQNPFEDEKPIPEFERICNASSGDLPNLPYHIRNEEALIRQLPPCVLPTVDGKVATQVALKTYPAAARDSRVS
jgi:hypothetical protein